MVEWRKKRSIVGCKFKFSEKFSLLVTHLTNYRIAGICLIVAAFRCKNRF